MSTAKFDTLSNLAGTQSVPVATVAQGVSRAWVNFNGTGTVAIRASFNVSSITDVGTGIYTVNFTNAMVDTNFATNANCSVHAGVQDFVSVQINSTISTSSIGIRTYSSGGIFDPGFVSVAIFR